MADRQIEVRGYLNGFYVSIHTDDSQEVERTLAAVRRAEQAPAADEGSVHVPEDVPPTEGSLPSPVAETLAEQPSPEPEPSAARTAPRRVTPALEASRKSNLICKSCGHHAASNAHREACGGAPKSPNNGGAKSPTSVGSSNGRTAPDQGEDEGSSPSPRSSEAEAPEIEAAVAAGGEHLHNYKLEPPNGPISKGTCACGATRDFANSAEGSAAIAGTTGSPAKTPWRSPQGGVPA